MTSLKYVMKKMAALMMAASLCLSMMAVPAAAVEQADEPGPTGSFMNMSGDGGENAISLCADRSFKAMIPVDMTEEAAQAGLETLEWNLDYLEE